MAVARAQPGGAESWVRVGFQQVGEVKSDAHLAPVIAKGVPSPTMLAVVLVDPGNLQCSPTLFFAIVEFFYGMLLAVCPRMPSHFTDTRITPIGIDDAIVKQRAVLTGFLFIAGFECAKTH